MEGRREAAEIAERNRAWLAWHSGALAQWNPKKFPKLAELYGEKPPQPRPMSGDEMLATLKAMQGHGGKMTIRRLN